MREQFNGFSDAQRDSTAFGKETMTYQTPFKNFPSSRLLSHTILTTLPSSLSPPDPSSPPKLGKTRLARFQPAPPLLLGVSADGLIIACIAATLLDATSFVKSDWYRASAA